MKAVVVQMPAKMIQECDELVKAKYYPNRNELIRMAVRDLLLDHKKFNFHQEPCTRERVILLVQDV